MSKITIKQETKADQKYIKEVVRAITDLQEATRLDVAFIPPEKTFSAFQVLKNERDRDLFKSIKLKIESGEALLSYEYYYFALVTDNCNELEFDALSEAYKSADMSPLIQANIDILLFLLKCKDEQDPQIKQSIMERCKDFLYENRDRVRHDGLILLNLAGLDLRNLDLSRFYLGFCNLENAKLNGAILKYTTLMYSNLSYADLRNINCKGWDATFRIKNSLFSHANLDGIEFFGTDLSNVIFDHASMRGCKLTETTNVNTSFDSADLTGTTITESGMGARPKANFHNAILVNANIEDYLAETSSFSGSIFLSQDAYKNVATLKKEIQSLQSQVEVYRWSNGKVLRLNALVDELQAKSDAIKPTPFVNDNNNESTPLLSDLYKPQGVTKLELTEIIDDLKSQVLTLTKGISLAV